MLGPTTDTATPSARLILNIYTPIGGNMLISKCGNYMVKQYMNHFVEYFLTVEGGWLFNCSGPGKHQGWEEA